MHGIIAGITRCVVHVAACWCALHSITCQHVQGQDCEAQAFHVLHDLQLMLNVAQFKTYQYGCPLSACTGLALGSYHFSMDVHYIGQQH